MPLSAQGSSFTANAIDFVGDRETGNNGPFVNPTYNDSHWNEINNRGIIVGLANYSGLISDLTKNKVIETAASTTTALAAGFLFAPFLDDNDDIYLIGSGGANREIGFSDDSGVSWSLLPNPPGISSVIRGMTIAQGRIFIIGTDVEGVGNTVAFSGNLGVAWTGQLSGLLFGGLPVGITTNADQTFMATFDNFGELAWTSTPLGSPPTWNRVLLATGAGGNVSQGAFNKNASKFVCAGISGEIHFSDDQMATFTQIDPDLSPLFFSDGGGGSISLVTVGYSAFHQGFIILTNGRIGAFIPENDMANPKPIYNISQAGVSPSGIMADPVGNFACVNAALTNRLYGSYTVFT